MDKPKPDKAPYLPAAFGRRQILAKKPTQLKKKAIMKALRNMHSDPTSWSLKLPSDASVNALNFLEKNNLR